MVFIPCFSRKMLATLVLLVAATAPVSAAFILNANIPTDISACQEVVFQLQLTNPEPSAQAGGSLQYCLPPGLQFVSANGLSVADSTDRRCPVFILPALPANGSLSFDIRVRAGCFDADLGDVRDTIRIVSGGQAQPPLLGAAYNVRTPVIILQPGQNWNYAGAAGELFTRTFILRNEGFGAAGFLFVIDSFQKAGLELVQTTGVFQGDTLVLTGAALGPDGPLGYLDSVVVTQTFRISDCAGQAGIVRYGWACAGGEICRPPWLDQYQVSGGVNPAPVLEIALNSPLLTPAPCTPQTLELRVENTGDAPALNLEWRQGLSFAAADAIDQSFKSDCFPLSDFRVGTALLTDSSGGSSDQAYRLVLSALTADPDGPGGLSDADGDGQFDDLAPGASLVLAASVSLSPACKPCNTLISPLFLLSQIRYVSSCAAAASADLAPSAPLALSFDYNTLTEDHAFILEAGTPVDFEYQLDASSAGLLDLCANDSIVLEFVLPEVLGLPAGFAPTFDSVAVPFWTVGDSLVYLLLPGLKGELVAPFLPICPPDIDDSAVCSPPYEPRTYQLPVNLRWRCGNGCPDAFELVCAPGLHFTVDCPRPEDTTQQHGVFADTLWVRRTSLGFTDNLYTKQIDPATPGLRLDTGIPFDTVLIVGEARFEGAGGDVFDSAGVQLYYWNGVQPYFELLYVGLMVDDAETGQSFNCSGLIPDYRLTNGYHIWEFDLLPLLAPGGCLASIRLTPGDRLRFEIQARLTESWPFEDVEQVKDLRLRFPYLYHGDSLLCEMKNALFQGINPDFDYSVGLLFPDTVCQDLEVAVHFFQGRSARIVNDLFPNEIRPLCVYDSLLVQLSPGYAYQPGSAFWKYQLGEMPPVPAQLALADPVAVSLSGGQEGLLFLRPAQLPVTDYYAGRAEASLHFRAQVLCPPDTSKFPVDIAGRRLLATLDALNLQVSTVAAGAPDFNELRLSALAPLAHTRTPHWQVEMCNSGPSFAIETPLLVVENGPALVLAAATDLTGPAPQSLNLVPLDSLRTAIQVLQLEPNSCRTIEITGSLTGCQTDTLRLRPAFQCADAAGPCILEHPLELYFSPRDAIAQIIVDGSPDSAVALCQALDYSVKIINVGEGFLYDLEIALGLPAAGQTLAPGSAVLEYNGQQAPLPDPVAGPDGLLRWTVDFSQLPFGLEALPSVLFLQSNAIALHFQINTDCAYLDGTRLLYGCSWRDACGPRKNSSLFVAPPLVLQGAPTATNDYQINLELENPASFCAENTLRLVVLNPGNLGATQAGEKLRLVVPAVFSYVPGSLQNLHNGPAGPPVALPFGDQRYLLFDLPAGVAAGDSLVFTLGLQRADSIAGCQAVESFRVQMTQTANVACLNSSCAIDFVLLEKTFIQIFEKPEFQLGGLSGASLPLDAGLENWQLNFNLENTSSLPGGGALQLEIRLDDNQNAALDASDPLLQVFSVDVEGLAPGAMQAVGAQVNVAAALGCSGLWVMLTDTLCSCSTDTVFIPFVRQENAGPDTLLCAGWPVQLGFVPQTGASYAWQPASPYLSDPLAANPQYLYAGPFGPGFEHQETLVLKTTRVQGCISFDTIQLITRQVQLSLTPSPALCAGDSTGAVQALVLGAADPVLYSWNQGQGTALDSVPAGQYALTVTDADGCTAAASAEVTEPLPLSLALVVSDFNGFGLSCAGAADGSLKAQAGGGVGGYQFDWTPAASGPVLQNLPAGAYLLTLTDANGCTLAASTTLTEPDSLKLSLVVADEICPDAANGSLTATVEGGVGPFLSGGQTVGNVFDLSGLSAGMYAVSVTDANGCMVAADTVVLLQRSEFSTLTDPVSCFGGADGRAEVSGTGFPPFGFTWSDGSSGAVLLAAAGTYQCSVTDALGCAYVLEMKIEQPAELVLSAMVQPVVCQGDSSGRVSLQAGGGVGGYAFFLAGQPVGQVVGQLPAGAYAFSVEDGNGCTATLDVLLDAPDPLLLHFLVNDARCFDSATGSIEAQPAGGVSPYALVWSTGATGPLLENVPAGWYWSTVTDARGCVRFDSVELGQPEPYTPVFEPLRLPCFDVANGILSVGGLPPGTRYALATRPLQSNPNLGGVAGGLQHILVEDSLGCLFEFEFDMPAYPKLLGLVVPDTVIRLGDSVLMYLEPAAGVGAVSWEWLAPLAPLTDCDSCASRWMRPFQTTAYAVRFTSDNGCQSEHRALVQVLRDSFYAPNVIYSGAVLDENRFFTLYSRPEAIRTIRFLRVFDRWGEAVFERRDFPVNDYQQGWNGTFRGRELLPGVYIWLAEVEYVDGVVVRLKGDVTLMR